MSIGLILGCVCLFVSQGFDVGLCLFRRKRNLQKIWKWRKRTQPATTYTNLPHPTIPEPTWILLILLGEWVGFSKPARWGAGEGKGWYLPCPDSRPPLVWSPRSYSTKQQGYWILAPASSHVGYIKFATWSSYIWANHKYISYYTHINQDISVSTIYISPYWPSLFLCVMM
jgi:hypothetical protein